MSLIVRRASPERVPGDHERKETYNPAKGWAKGPLFIIMIVVVLCAAFFLAFALVLAL
ncbi:DUF6480 family protein [Streptomyces sp. NBC_00287]|uniref:DUF6480 family protein n=1 Tax=Streptomyces sp. NBC_00287 TaxID=2975702 RepID=UPI002E282635|nr:DUF6480 family protein [Streptomyces sp. NBC_00287]